MRRFVVISLALTLFAGAAYWSSTDEATLSEMELVRLTGRVEVLRAGEALEVDDKLAIRPGDVIATYGETSGARLRLQGEREVELGADSELTVDGITSVTGRAGAFLTEAGDKTTVAFGDVEANTAEGVLRIDVGYGSARAGVYSGTATLSAAEQEDTTITPLFQSSVAGTYVSAPHPLKVSARDPWDLLHLGDVLDLDEQLERLGRGLQTQLRNDRPTLPYVAALVEKENVRFVKKYLNRSVPNLLIALSIAGSTEGPFERTFVRAFDLSDAGGQWGVVSEILGANSNRLVAQLQDVVLSTRVALDGGNRIRFSVASASDDAAGRGRGNSAQGGGGSKDGDGSSPTDTTTLGGSGAPGTTTTGGGTDRGSPPGTGDGDGGSTGDGGTGGTGGDGGTGGTGGDGGGTGGGTGGTGGDGGGTGGGGGGGGDGGGGGGGGDDGGGGGGGDGECDPLQDPTCIVPPLPVPTPTGILP